MIEKAYKTMGHTGVVSLAAGIIMIVAGISAGVLTIIGGARLLKTRKGLIF